jgi:hypothetical protein
MRKRSTSAGLAALSSVLPEDLLRGDYDVLARHIAKLPLAKRRLLVRRCRTALQTSSVVRHTRSRVAVCKVLCATAPESAKVIREWLEPGTGRDRYEVQFSLFCFLDRVPENPKARRFARTIPAFVERYLIEVPRPTARTAWMAGHMMGDHWPKRTEAVAVLSRALAGGRYKAGRRAAEMALRDLLDERVSNTLRRKIRASLERAN